MPPPPVLGFNNNVRHRGRVFHIQTEDSGMQNPRIMTHLFADGGRIVKSTRTDYAEHLDRGDVREVVRNLMKEQHKAMFVALRSGELDRAIGFASELPPSTKQAAKEAAAVAAAPAPTSARAPEVAAASSSEPESPSYGAPRPAAIFEAPTRVSLFGDTGTDEKSLDEAILSYLSEEGESNG